MVQVLLSEELCVHLSALHEGGVHLKSDAHQKNLTPMQRPAHVTWKMLRKKSKKNVKDQFPSIWKATKIKVYDFRLTAHFLACLVVFALSLHIKNWPPPFYHHALIIYWPFQRFHERKGRLSNRLPAFHMKQNFSLVQNWAKEMKKSGFSLFSISFPLQSWIIFISSYIYLSSVFRFKNPLCFKCHWISASVNVSKQWYSSFNSTQRILGGKMRLPHEKNVRFFFSVGW